LWPRAPVASTDFDSHLLDNISVFPDVQQSRDRTTEELASSFKKSVFIVTRHPRWNLLPRENLFRMGFGSGVLIFAGKDGYLVLTSRHVIDSKDWQHSRPYSGNVALVREEGDFTSAKIAGRHRSLDLILLRVERHSGNSSFAQPVVEYSKVPLGERILVFGHPVGLFFSVSDGIVSRKDDANNLIQITAPVGPGTSGGPAYDIRGRLVGVVSAMMDKGLNPQSENLNFAVRADALLRPEEWSLDSQGAQLIKDFVAASQVSGTKTGVSSTSSPTLAKPTFPPTKPKPH
jgi:S1-C subfamily serine protease